MKVVAIIAEYNPFHNGHLYHLKKTLEVTGATHSVAIMSGHFLQRGEPSLVNKWARAEMAVAAGVDLVIELPVVYSCRSAEAFATGALSILDKTNVVDCICFGSESGDLEQLQYIANILSTEPKQFKEQLKYYLGKGLSFPSARSKALQAYAKTLSPSFLKILCSPNNILALEYLKAIHKLKSSIQPYTIKRIKAEYNSTDITDSIASATAIRKAILESKGDLNRIKKVIPQASLEILQREFALGKGPVQQDSFSSIVIGQLRRSNPEDLSKYPEVSEGLEYKIWKSARNNLKISCMLKEIKSKRYTLTRLKRIAIYILLEIHSHLLDELKNSQFPGYVRVLAFNNKGREILRKIKLNSPIPIISKTARHPLTQGALVCKMLEKDLIATDIYVLGYLNPKYAFAGQDFLSSPILVDH